MSMRRDLDLMLAPKPFGDFAGGLIAARVQ